MEIGDTLKRGLGAITGRNLEVTAEKLAEVHGEILLGMDKRLDSLERRLDAVPDPASLMQRIDDVERQLEADRRELRRTTILAVAAITVGVLALIGASIALFGRS